MLTILYKTYTVDIFSFLLHKILKSIILAILHWDKTWSSKLFFFSLQKKYKEGCLQESTHVAYEKPRCYSAFPDWGQQSMPCTAKPR